MRNGIMLAILGCVGCGTTPPPPPPPPVELPPEAPAEPPPPVRPVAGPVLISGVTLLTAELDRPRIEKGWLRLEGGRIAALGEGDPPSAGGAQVVVGDGMFVTPGLIDTHSHLGVAPVPVTPGNQDSNEATNPITAGVRAEDSFWPGDPTISRALAGGTTTIHVIPGSQNVIGGRGVVLKLHPALDTRDMRFPGAPDSLKMACGENPKERYGDERDETPSTRMGSVAMMRESWIAAQAYRLEDDGFRDLNLETLAGVLAGDILVHVHCYRADEMMVQIRMAKEFGYDIRSFHHATDAYKIRDVLAQEQISVSTWVDWWGAKLEGHDAIPQNLALLEVAGGIPVLHTDSREGVQRMNQEMAKGYYAGVHAGVPLTQAQALRWVTWNAAWALGVEEETGSLAVGKMADVVLWDRDPFSVYARAQKVFVDGHLRFDRAAPQGPRSDFEVGL